MSLETLQIEEFGIDTPYLISQCIWFCCMLLGLDLKEHGKKLDIPKKVISICITGIKVVLFLTIKLLMRRTEYLSVQGLLALVYVGFAYSLFRVFMSSEESFHKHSGTWGGKLIFLVSACSLEVYYTQFLWINTLKEVVFPLNLLMLCAAIVVTSYLVHRLSGFILQKLGFVKSRSGR